MTIDKLPSGSYRVRLFYNGKRRSMTFKNKPKEQEVYKQAELLYGSEEEIQAGLSFQQAAEQHNASKEAVISPTTYDSYESILRNLSDDFKAKDIYLLTSIDIQNEISNYALTRSAKTVKNAKGYIVEVLRRYMPEKNFILTVPKAKKELPYIPTDNEVKCLLERARTYQGGIYYIPIYLCCYGLRRSELIALTLNDLNGNVFNINKDKIYSRKKKEWIIRYMPKTSESIRKVVISQDLADAIRKQGYIYDGHPGNISRAMKAIEKELGIEDFSQHKMRHYFASTMSGVVPDADIIAMGGWSTDGVMKTVYRHSLQTKNLKAQEKAVKKLNKILK